MRPRQDGQVIVLFALFMVVLLLAASVVVDLGLLRNDRQTLVNAVDAGALAGGTVMPVDGSKSGAATAVDTLVVNTVKANYLGIPSSAYAISYRCLIGTDASSPPQPYISRDIPLVCDPSHSLGRAPVAADFIGAGPTRFSSCDPFRGDKCNTIVVTGTVTRSYSFGRVAGVTSGSTGTVSSAACNGPCGQPPYVPLDAVLIIDRTGSMAGDEANLQNAADAVLQVYFPDVQHVALGTLGPSATSATCAGAVAVHSLPLTLAAAPAPPYGTASSGANVTGGAATVVVTKPASTVSGDFLLASVTVAGGTGTTIATLAGWTLIRRTDSTTNVSVASYYKFAGASEPATYTWTLGSTVRAVGGIVRYTGVDAGTPIDASGGASGLSGTIVTAPAITTTVANTSLVGVFSTNTGATFTPAAGLTERYDTKNPNAAGPSTEAATATQAAAGSTGTKAATATVGGPWVAQLVALRPVPTNAYGTNTVTDLAKWVPVGLAGNGAPVNELYVDSAGTLNPASILVNGIACAANHLSGTGTNLSTPLRMATAYLAAYGRAGVKKGIILETDGTPNYNGSSGDSSNYTCSAALSAATDAKAAGIEIFTIGFGVAGAVCPDGGAAATTTLANMATGPVLGTSLCDAAENTDGDHFFCEPAGADLASVFRSAALQLANLHSHLVQLYPIPVVTAVAPATGPAIGGTSITITGKYFSGATSVSFGTKPATSFTVNSDTSITAVAPAGSAGSTVDIVVDTPGGTTSTVAADRYAYT